MTKIRVLPEVLANKIAAGEIVERPASIVKELLENSLDARARSISIIVESGGKKLISVCDDGEGMSQDDAILAFDHHATSKIRSVEDLGAICTLGFRGEALPSMASVSRLVLKTRETDSSDLSAGVEIEIQGGIMRGVKPISWNTGTEVTVRDLFFNLPARRKFLRSNETELAHITRLATHYALAYPEVRFVLKSDGRSLINVVPVESLRERIYQLFGDAFLENLIEIAGQAGTTNLHGFTSLPHEQRTNSYSQFFYVNRRMVRDKVITSAVRQAYHHCMPASAFPVVLLFLTLPYDEVDVNAHPSKIEIRFRQQTIVHEMVRESIQRGLVQGKTIAVFEHRGNAMPADGQPESPASMGFVPDAATPGESLLSFPPVSTSDTATFQKAFSYPFRAIVSPPPYSPADHKALKIRADMLLSSPMPESKPLQSLGARILGQIHDSYIIAAEKEGLLIIDQHVAHERILYEKLAGAGFRSQVESQGLLVPITVELPAHQVVLFDKVRRELEENGLRIERFGGNTVLVRAVPAIASDCDCQKLLEEILEGVGEEERTLDVQRIREKIAVSTACHAAIKVHTPLTMEKMQWLLDELALTRIPTNCPHGRPIILRFSLFEIERNFGRA
jgi:DNA mismatch repair protein MutL